MEQTRGPCSLQAVTRWMGRLKSVGLNLSGWTGMDLVRIHLITAIYSTYKQTTMLH